MANADEVDRPSWVLTLASIAVVTAALYLAKGILIPLTLAVLLSFLLSPVCDWLEHRGLGRVPAVMGTVFLAFALLAIVAWTSLVQIRDLAPNLPEYQQNIQSKIRVANDYVKVTLHKITRTAKEIDADLSAGAEEMDAALPGTRPYSVRVIPDPPSPLQLMGGMFGTLLQILGSLGIVIVLVIFFLIRREDLRDRFIRLVGRGKVTITTQALEDATSRVSRYLAMQLLINVAYGIPVAIGLYFIGVPNAMLWGILATVLRFIPYLGPWIGAALPIILSMAISRGWGPPLQTVAMFLVLELFSNNVMEPWLYGRNTGVSPVAVLVAAIFWSWLWGPIGLLLATPLTVCLLVIGKHVPLLSFLDILLGDEPVFEPKTRVYQRLLAGDQEEANELVESFLERKPLVEVYDSILIPVLANIESHRLRDEVDERRCRFMFQSVREIVDDIDPRQPTFSDDPDVESPEQLASAVEANAGLAKLCIVCVPARGDADDIAGVMLAQVLDPLGCLVQSVSPSARLGEIVELVNQLKADVVCVSATAPAAVMHARTLSKHLRRRFPKVKLLVGLWGARGDLTRAKQRIGGGDQTVIVSKLSEVQQQIALVLQPQFRNGSKAKRKDEQPTATSASSGAALP